MKDEARYGIAELAELGGVSRRTVRYYVHMGLLPSAEGTGRGAHYTDEHLSRLVEVRRAQEGGVPLADLLGGLSGRRAVPLPAKTAMPAALWARLRIADDIELLVRADGRHPWHLPGDGRARIEAAIREELDRIR